MSQDQKINQILSEAEKLKKKEQERLEKEKTKSFKKLKETPKTPSNDETWRVYRALFGRSVGFLWLLPLVLIPVVYIMYIDEPNKLLGYLAIIIAIPTLRWLELKISLYLGYSKFRKWRTQLPFELIGWENIVDSKYFDNTLYWRLNACVKIEFQTKDLFNEKVLTDMLFLLCKKMEKCFYTPEFAIAGFASDPRKHWEVQGNLIKGSLNNQVVFEIYKFLSQELKPLAFEYQNVQRVILEASHEEYKIEPERVSSD
ncbi:hypothetical protein AD998_05055 [bacterium 336/3]|nr:hypothetical protein AD998_05055 [bacterium 336/3]